MGAVRRAAQLTAVGRLVLGVAVLAAPERVMTRWLGPANAVHGGVKDLGRGLAARDIALGLAALWTLEDPVLGPRVQLGCALADGADAVSTVLERDSLPTVGVIGTVLVAGGAALAGVYFARELAREG